jgi:nicotinamide riboside transporter PnuC
MSLSSYQNTQELAKKINLELLFSLTGVIFTFEILSFLSYRTPWLTSTFFVIICLATAAMTYKKLEWGLLVILPELLWAGW